MSHWQAFVFDFDGVLADSVEVKTRAFAKLYEPFGENVVAHVVDHHRQNGGMNRFDKFRYYHDKFLGQPLSDRGVEDIALAFSKIVIDEVVASPEIPGAENFIRKYCNEISCFINSATPEQELREIVKRRGLALYFVDLKGAPSSKDDNLEAILEQYQLNPRRCLFFGDAISDYRAAIAHNVDFVGIVPNESAPLLKGAPDINWKRNFHEVVNWLKASQL